MSNRFFIFIFFFLIVVFGSKGQNRDTSKTTSIYIFNKDDFFKQSKIDSLIIDTTISFIHKYLPSDTLVAFQYLGSPGLAFKSSEISNDENLYDLFLFNRNLNYFSDNSLLIVARKRFTNLQYVLGSKKEQFLTVLHSQNITKGLNASIKYQRLSAEGFFRRQNSKLSQFEFFPWYEAKNYRYAVYANLNVKDFQIQENGGVTLDTSSSDVTDLNLLEINLLSAENRTRKFTSSIFQKGNFGKRGENPRTFMHSIVHKLNYSDEKNTFTDSDPTNQFYFTTYYDTSLTDDILNIININNFLKYSLHVSNEISISFHAINDILEVKQKTLDTTFNNFIGGGELYYYSNFVKFNVKGEYCLGGSNEGNLLVNPNLKVKLLNNYLVFSYTNKISYPDLMFRIFQSNHFSWYNFLKEIKSQKFDFSIHSENISTTAFFKYLSLKNYTYINEFSRPVQFSDNLNYISLQLKNMLRFGKFGVETKGIWQKVSNEEIVNLPEFSLDATLFFESKLFKNALQTKSGIDVNYISRFKGDKYMPPLRHFYLQNEIDVGGFTQLDFFINFKVKTARVFLKIENITSEGGNDFNYTVPGYPLPGRVFKVGVNWMFFD